MVSVISIMAINFARVLIIKTIAISNIIAKKYFLQKKSYNKIHI